jgi:tetratricopeptide (TPR) repeat protein
MKHSHTMRRIARQTSDWEARKLIQGQRAFESGDKVKAVQYFARILGRNPKCWPAVFSYAVIAHSICEHATAIACLRRMTQAVPDVPEAWYNLGTMLQCVNDYQGAADALRRAVDLMPDMVNARVNLGNALLGLGRTEEAFAEYAVATTMRPNSAEAVWNLAHYYILTGQWIAGWQCYEARWKIPGFTELNAITIEEGRADMPRPWQGQSLVGKTLIVSGEQGWGDDIMCLRYAPQLRALGATVIWALRPGLMRLAALTVTPDRVVSLEEPVPCGDFICTTMTLHHRLQITPETIPGAAGYLKAA